MVDILIDNDYELRTINSDFLCGESLEQDIQLLLVSAVGHFKNEPKLGVDLIKYLNGNRMDEAVTVIKQNLKMDGKKFNSISLTEGHINIDAQYGKDNN